MNHRPDLLIVPAVVGLGAEGRHRAALTAANQQLVVELSVRAGGHVCTVSEVRHAFTKHGGNLGTDGSVSYLFNKVGSIVYSSEDEENIMDIALEAGADDIESEDGMVEVMTPPESFHEVLQKLKDAGLEEEMSELIQRPSTETELTGEDAEKVMKMIDALEELDDVQDVFTNASFPEEV